MVSNWQKKEELVSPYSKLAFIYDEVMSHVNYKGWAKYINKIIKKWNPNAHSLIDIACGTGNFINIFRKYGLQLAGFDYSLNSIKAARNKLLLHNEKKIPLWCGDIQKFSLKFPVDVIICLYDSINYIMEISQLTNVMENAYHNLKPGGLFIFDICTEKNSVLYFDNYFDRNRGKGYSYTRNSQYDRKEKIHSNLFKINFDESKKIYVEEHRQKIFYIDQILYIINEATLNLVAVLDDFTFNKGTENSIRVHFILQRN